SSRLLLYEMLAYQQKESTARVASIMENTNLSKQQQEIGRASCRERVEISGGAVSLEQRGAHRAAGRDIEDLTFHGVQVLHRCFPCGTDCVSYPAGDVATQ